MKENRQKSNLLRFLVIGSLLFVCLGLEYFLHIVRGITYIYPHIFYIPIIVAGLWWGLKGGLSTGVFLGLMHTASYYDNFQGFVLLRALLFVLVGYTAGMIINQRMRAEKSILRLNEMLRLIRDINQVIFQVDNEPGLLRKIADRFIIDYNYKFAWIGFIQAGSRDVLPMAHAGFEDGYLSSVKITWDDSEYGRGPTGVAIKTAQPSVMHDIVNDPQYRPWREDALKRGYRSLIALPLTVENKVIGALNIYSERPDAFDDAELSLCVELAGDISLGIEKIRQRENLRRSNAALRESEEKFRAMNAAANDGVIMIDNEGKVAYWNKAAEKIFGHTDEEILGKELHRILVPKRFYKAFEIGFSKFKMTGQGAFVRKTRELAAVKKDGMEFPTELSMSAIKIGGKWNAIALARDITERKQAEEKIKEYSKNLERMVEVKTGELNQALYDSEEARDRTDAILKSVGNGLIVTDMYNNIILMNGAAEELLGVRFSEVIGGPFDFAIEERSLTEKVKDTLDKKKIDYQFDFKLPGDDPKHPRIIHARTSEIKHKSDKQTGIVTIIHDVTQEREVDRMKTEFISTAAHELRTPLTSIQGFSELLITRDDISEEEKNKFLSYINKQAINLAGIVSDLLNISRIESGRGFALNKVKCMAGEAIKQVIPCFQGISSKHKIELVLPDKPVELLIDKEKMEQGLKNLLSNAIKYSPDGGTICLTAKRISDFGFRIAEYPIADGRLQNACPVECEAYSSGADLKDKKQAAIEISIADQGIGMTPDQVKQIFDKFYRVDASDSAPEGTGLGMTIVKYIVEAHGGKIWIESKLGKGTTVTFVIPTT